VADDRALTLDELQGQVLLRQIGLFSKANPDPQAQREYSELATAVGSREVPPELIQRLTAILEISLTGDRVRRTAGPGAHLALAALFQKTPRGKELAAQVSALNAALAQLKDQRLVEISATQRGPATYSFTIGTDSCRMVIRFEPEGVRVESLDVGME
jgi:hypothetical protein